MSARQFPRAGLERIYDFFSRRAAMDFVTEGSVEDSAALVQISPSGEIEKFVPTPGFTLSARDSVTSHNRSGELLRFMFASAVDSTQRQVRAWGTRVDAVVVTCTGTVVVDPTVLSQSELRTFVDAGWPIEPADPLAAICVTIHTPGGSHIGVLLGFPGSGSDIKRVARGPLWPSEEVTRRLKLRLSQDIHAARAARRLRIPSPAASDAFRRWMDRIARGASR